MWDQKQNIIFVTHYVVISELLNYAPSSGEIVISDKNLKVIDTLDYVVVWKKEGKTWKMYWDIFNSNSPT